VRFTIERLRNLVLAAGILLVVSLVAFLAVGKFKKSLNLKDIPTKLGIGITRESNGVTYTQSHNGHTLFKLHAAKVEEHKKGTSLLHDVKIDLYSPDGKTVDRIEGAAFEWDEKAKIATAVGPVEITLVRPGVAPAIAPKAGVVPKSGEISKNPLGAAFHAASEGEIHVKTSGLVFDQQTGIATTSAHVDFSLAQGTGSSMGASYDSQQGRLVLDRVVELATQRGGETVQVRAQHAEFGRESLECQMHAASATYRGGEATAGDAKILFRQDGSAVRLDALNGLTLVTESGSHVAAPMGRLDFGDRNQPRHGHMEGGVTMDSETGSHQKGPGRQLHGTSPNAELAFSEEGVLRRVHLERGVQMHSEERSASLAGILHVSREWKSPLADIDFREGPHGQIEPATIHGIEGVEVTGESQRGTAPMAPSRFAADEVTGVFGPDSALSTMTGTGHARVDETTPNGTLQDASGDRLEARFVADSKASPGKKAESENPSASAMQIESVVLLGHVLLVQQEHAKAGAAPPPAMRATAGKAVYAGVGEWLHLTLNPRVDDGGLQLTADQLDVSRDSGDAFAHGNVKSTWLGSAAGQPQAKAPGQGTMAFGGQGPAHVIAAEAQMHQATGEATFKGHARLWQQDNSVSAPVIVLDRLRQTLVARSTDPAEPVRAVLVSAANPAPGKAPAKTGKPAAPSVIRVRGGDLKYSDAERKAVMHGGALGTVVAETDMATSVSKEVELRLLPPGNHAGKDGSSAQVDRMVARGQVTVTSGGRRGNGEQLVYTGDNGEYVLTGTAAAPPRMMDPGRGTVVGEALIFNSRDDSVTVEGGAKRTTTETMAPK
jgi:lipopolysaccharide export system protein LptA